jgi:hypothetical protein
MTPTRRAGITLDVPWRNVQWAMHFVHRACGHDVGGASVCPNCGVPVERKDLQPSISERFLAERTARREAFKGK